MLVRHGETDYNVARCVNGDPSKPVHLTELGRAQARALEPSVARVAWGSAWHTRFPRTRETLDLLLPDGRPARHVIPELDDIDVGELEGETIDAVARLAARPWARGRARRRRVAVERAAPLRTRLRSGSAREAALPAIVVCHDQAIRYLENVLAGEDPLFGPVQDDPERDARTRTAPADMATRCRTPRCTRRRRRVASLPWKRFRSGLDGFEASSIVAGIESSN